MEQATWRRHLVQTGRQGTIYTLVDMIHYGLYVLHAVGYWTIYIFVDMIRVLHTADWHIGQFFHEYDRSYEHLQFLNWLLMVLAKEEIDVLLVSGDIFDSSNPSAASLKIFYWFLNQSVKQNPHLQVVVTAGNHDSASRLESPKPLLESIMANYVFPSKIRKVALKRGALPPLFCVWAIILRCPTATIRMPRVSTPFMGRHTDLLLR